MLFNNSTLYIIIELLTRLIILQIKHFQLVPLVLFLRKNNDFQKLYILENQFALVLPLFTKTNKSSNI